MGRTPLLLAAQNQQLSAMEILIKNEADEDALDNKNNSALYWACFYNLVEAVDYLADQSEVLNIRNHIGFTPLLISSSIGHAECVRTLLKYGSAVDFEPMCCSNLPGGNTKEEKTYRPGNSALMIAAQHGHVNICRELFSHDPALEIRDHGMISLLYYLIPYAECIQQMLEKGASADAYVGTIKSQESDMPGNHIQPVHRAVIENHNDSLICLLQANCKLSHRGRDQCRLKLPDAIVKGSLDCVKTLFSYSIEIGENVTWLHTYLGSRPLNTLSNIRPNVAVVRNWLQSQMRTYVYTPSLIRLCRRVIKRHMSSTLFMENVQINLPLPLLLKQYLIMSEIKDIR